MIYIITGPTHTGKTMLAQKILEKHNINYISLDHIKMGLIRNNFLLSSNLKDSDITDKLWPIIKEIIKTAIENRQDLIIEGCYIPFNYKGDFDDSYLKYIKYVCLLFSEEYINNYYNEIVKYESCIEKRKDSSYFTKELLKSENNRYIEGCNSNNLNYVLIEDDYLDVVDEIIDNLFL